MSVKLWEWITGGDTWAVSFVVFVPWRIARFGLGGAVSGGVSVYVDCWFLSLHVSAFEEVWLIQNEEENP